MSEGDGVGKETKIEFRNRRDLYLFRIIYLDFGRNMYLDRERRVVGSNSISSSKKKMLVHRFNKKEEGKEKEKIIGYNDVERGYKKRE